MKPSSTAAIAILEVVKERCGSAVLAYWVTPNTILTLSGARAYCDGVFWDDKNTGMLSSWQKEIHESLGVIKQQEVVLYDEAHITEARPTESYAGYELLFKTGLQYVLGQTTLVDASLYDQLLETQSLGNILNVLEEELAKNLQVADYTENNIKDIAIGLLLGYPDKAMLASVKLWDTDKDSFGEPLMPADIRGANYYDCPQPVYSYPRSLGADKDIMDHERLWSSILQDYYKSAFHASLELDEQFIAKSTEIGNIG